MVVKTWQTLFRRATDAVPVRIPQAGRRKNSSRSSGSSRDLSPRRLFVEKDHDNDEGGGGGGGVDVWKFMMY